MNNILITTIVAREYAPWLPLTALNMLIGIEGEDWGYYVCDKGWWAKRLLTRIN